MRALLLIVLAVACTKASDSGRAGSDSQCPAFSVTVDGAPLSAMTNGLAFSYKLNGTVQWHVDISNLEMGCERYMGRDGRILRDGEQTVRAFTGVSPGVGIDNLSVPHEKVEVVGATPSKPGDKLALCVAEASFSGGIDAYKDKKIVMSGKLEGTYCGDQTF